MSKIIEITRTGANCECCWVYEARALDLDCWHQIVWREGEYKEWQDVECYNCKELLSDD